MTAHVTSILSKSTKTTGLCLGLLAVAQFNAYASTHITEVAQSSQRHSRELVSVANKADTYVATNHAGNRNESFSPPVDDTSSLEPTEIATSGRYFVPPTDDTRPLEPTGTGSVGRGGSCSTTTAAGEKSAEFTALGPQSMEGLTTEERPLFNWYISPSEQDTLVVFYLMEIEEDGRETVIHASEDIIAQTGFMSYQLPTDAPSLEVGKNYLWEVSVFCNSNNDVLAGTLPIRVVSPSTELTAQLSTATTNAEKAIIYGNAGLWYDAFAQVISGTTPDDRTVRTGLLQDLAAGEDNQAISTVLLAILEQTDDL